MDFTIFEKSGKVIFVENQVILPNKESKDIITGLKYEPAAVLINSTNKGYCRVIFDLSSAQFFL
jgi:hypothetical protein